MNYRLALKIKEKGFTQGKLAKRLGTSASYLSQLIHGRREMKMSMIKELAKVLGISIDYMLGFSDAELVDQPTKQYFKKSKLRLRPRGHK